MAITLPRTDVFTEGKFRSQTFLLKSRQELSSNWNGIVRAKSFGTGLWQGSWVTVPHSHEDGVDFEAVLNSLNGMIHGFYAGDLRRQYPLNDPTGTILGASTVQIHSLQSETAWRLKGLPNGYIISRGDYMSYDYGAGPSRALVQAMETVAAVAGVTPSFQIRSLLRVGTTVDQVVTLKKPTALFQMMPEGFESGTEDVLSTVTSFSAIQRL